MDFFQKALSSLGAIRTPITVTALIIVVFYYILSQLLQLQVFSTLTQADTGHFLTAVLDKIFWLAIAGLVFGAILFALPHILPDRLKSTVELVDARINHDLGTNHSERKGSTDEKTTRS
ncbi:hypothetical protein GFM13_16355 [Rhizobium leguminosarum bv. viciae]|nr:hypothetical protein [Rhizobium leguminosarum bv. viciae]